MQQHADVVIDLKGNVIKGASVRVLLLDGTLATIYAANGGAPTNNPIPTGPKGEFAFFAPNGDYLLEISAGGKVQGTQGPVKLYDVLDDGDAARLSSLAAGDGSNLVGFGQRKVGDKLGDTASLKDKGAAGDGTVDDTAAISAVTDVVEVTPGVYKCVGVPAADPALLDVRPGAKFVGMKNGTTNIAVLGPSGEFQGWQQNSVEQTSIATPTPAGWIKPPPLSTAAPTSAVDVLAHFYNDTGLECVRLAAGALGSTHWYTGYWNHTTTTDYGPYDPKRHPKYGWYHGDDPVVLDNICYDLREAGVKAVILYTGNSFDTDLWGSAADRGYWLYQLFTNVPNFKGMGYVVNGPYSGITSAQLKDRWNKIIAQYLAHPHFYCMNIDGGLYPTIYLHDAGVIRTSVFAGSVDGSGNAITVDAAFEAWLKDIASQFKAAGYAGVAVMAKNGTYYTNLADTTTADRYARAFSGSGVVMFESEYATSTTPATFSDYVSAFAADYASRKTRLIPNVMTSRESKYHGSGWTTTGSTPELFGRVLRQAALAAKNNPTIPNIVTVYNVSEWGEGGAGLIPNLADGYGYPNQIRTVDAISSPEATDIFTYKRKVDSNSSVAGNNIKPIGDLVGVYSSSSLTLNGTYVAYQGGTIAPGYPNQQLTLVNTADVGSFFVRLCDVTNYANSGLYLNAPTIDLNPWDTITLRYISGKGWVQQGVKGKYELNGSATYDPPSLLDGEGVTTTVTVSGAALGDFALASFSLNTAGLIVTAWVSATNTVSVRLQNETGATVDLASGTLRARVLK